MARLLIDDVTLAKTDQIHLHVRFRGGQTTSLTIPDPADRAGRPARPTPTPSPCSTGCSTTTPTPKPPTPSTPPGTAPARARPFTRPIVLHLRRAHSLPSHAERLRARGLLTIDEIAERLDVHRSTIKDWHHAGLLDSHKANDKNERLYEPPTPGDPRLVKRMGSRLANRVLTEPTPGGAV